MKKTILFSFFLLACSLSQAQNSTELPNNPRLIKANEAKQARIAEQNESKSVKVSEYFGLEDQILSFLVTKEIPNQLPKAKGYATKAKYVESLNVWMKENPSLVLPEKQNQLITE
jgi:hypothetical protein